MAKTINAFKILRTLHLSITGGLLIFIIVAIALERTGMITMASASLERVIQVVAVAVSVLCLVVGFNVFKKKIMQARNSELPAEKRMAQYLAACVIWWALIELGGMVAVIGFVLTLNYAFVALGAFHILILLIFMPRRDNIILLLQLNAEEVDRLEGK